MTKAWLEGVNDDGWFLVGGQLCNFSHGGELKEFGDLVSEDVSVLRVDVEVFGDKDLYMF